ncbi:MAG TPA: hypothetical protein VGJ72_15700 [Polaromonas sp.]|jgi:hypothetical protein|nr:hypothetical protein [Lysobacter sp.]
MTSFVHLNDSKQHPGVTRVESALALFAGTARNLAARVKAGLDGWSRSLAEARAGQRIWED